MKLRNALLLVFTGLITWPVWAQDPSATNAPAGSPVAAVTTIRYDLFQATDGGVPSATASPTSYLYPEQTTYVPLGELGQTGDTAVRFGWWGTKTEGSTVKTGEYQNLKPSPFWDYVGLYSNGNYSLDMFANQTDNEANQLGAKLYGPGWKNNLEFQRFERELDHIPLDNLQSANSKVVHQDLNVGEDYAIRVEEFRDRFRTKVTDNITFNVDVWAMRKFGDRQENAVAHCYAPAGPARPCHVLSQSQQIDWLTTEVTPRIEGRFGPLTIEYSRIMRVFDADDQAISRNYAGPASAKMINGVYQYAEVSDNFTQIDQVKMGLDLGPNRHFYGFGYIGSTESYFRDMNRSFNGYDLRLTDSSIQNLRLTAYARLYNQNGIEPTFLLPSETQYFTAAQAWANIRQPLEYNRNTFGINGRYLLGNGDGDWFGRLALTAGYDYDYLARNNAVWEQSAGAFQFFQDDTRTHTISVGLQDPITETIDTYVRNKVVLTTSPLYGFRQDDGFANTNLPLQQDIVEFGGDWYPSHNFAFMFNQEIELSRHNDENLTPLPQNVISFHEDSYNTTLTAWYAPTNKLSFTTSGAFLNNWINQNITLGTDYVEPGQPPGNLIPPATGRWYYGGTSFVFNLRAYYRLTEHVRLSCGYDYVRGKDGFDDRGLLLPWIVQDLPGQSAVLVVTNKLTAGVDWKPRDWAAFYLRFNYTDYDDKTNNYNSGTAYMLLAGLSLYH